MAEESLWDAVVLSGIEFAWTCPVSVEGLRLGFESQI